MLDMHSGFRVRLAKQAAANSKTVSGLLVRIVVPPIVGAQKLMGSAHPDSTRTPGACEFGPIASSTCYVEHFTSLIASKSTTAPPIRFVA
jgi:hypothetical protein